MINRLPTASIISALVLMLFTSFSAQTLPLNEEDAVHVKAFNLPESALLDGNARVAVKSAAERQSDQIDAESKTCPPIATADRDQLPSIRKCQANAFYRSSWYKLLRDRYDVVISSQEIGGIQTEVFTPADSIAPKNKNRVLLNLHGGAFIVGARTFSHLESIPIASSGKIKVISIDYRQAPEYSFPAASEDVAAVYRQLLKTYEPKNIGIYGCSAGGLLTAQVVAWLQNEKLPQPGAVGMFCGAADYWMKGDSGYLGTAIIGVPVQTSRDNPYLKNAEINDPLAFPLRSSLVMAKFPPALLIASSRDYALSSVVQTHSVLIRQGVEAELHVWEGVSHAFIFHSELSQSQEAFSVMIKFFDTHLGM